jgi:hypothetical protein
MSLELHELKQHKPGFDEDGLGFLEQGKETKMQWVQDPSQSYVDNVNNVRRETHSYFRKNGKNI